MRRVKDLHELVLQGADRADALIVLLHGLGADGADLEPLGAAMLAALPGARIVLPTAPRRPVGIAGGLPMRAWFDVGPADILRTHASDPAGVAQAEGWLRGLLEREARSGIPTTRMVVGGFSQGGALAAWFAPRHSLPLAGVMALSTFMATNAPFEAEVHSANRALPARRRRRARTRRRAARPVGARRAAGRLARLRARACDRRADRAGRRRVAGGDAGALRRVQRFSDGPLRCGGAVVGSSGQACLG
jgi:phospholipase/carboxylesterase